MDAITLNGRGGLHCNRFNISDKQLGGYDFGIIYEGTNFEHKNEFLCWYSDRTWAP